MSAAAGAGVAPGATGTRTRAHSAWARVGATVARVPRAGRWCFLIAFVNAAIWGVLVPPFQVPDEIAHFGYAQYVAQTGKAPPQGPGAQYSPQEQSALVGLHFFTVIGRPEQRGIMTAVEDEVLHSITAGQSPTGDGGSTSVTNQPPLYYYLEAIPYWLSPSSFILNRLALMRLLSALLAAGTVLAIYLFLRELLPGTPWAWTVGALAVAFQPTFAFISAGVQGDNLLYLTSAATFLLLLRAYRHGFTTRRAAIIGLVVGAGLLTKLTYIALVPGIALALLLLAYRRLPEGRGPALKSLATAVAVAAAPVLLYVLLNIGAWHRGSPLAGGLAVVGANRTAAGGAVTMNETLDYIWQLYLPRLWFMHHTYYATWPFWETWFNAAVGHFGWLDYSFPGWVYTDGRWVLYVLVALALAGTVRLRRSIVPLLPILGCFAVMALGLLAAIGYSGLRYKLSTGNQFEQARYLFPLLALYGAFLVLAAKGAGRRWGPAVAAAIVLLAMAHGLFAETLTISRYYG